MKKLLMVATLIVAVGCQTFYSSVVTVTQIRKSVLNELGVMSRNGQISDATDKRIQIADDQFKMAARSMELALAAYKAGTSTNDPALKLLEVKAPVQELIGILTPLAGSVLGNKYTTSLTKATQL
jgi:hypothetical protein